jgi:L-ribulose-5-phosphate 4-epimerase
VEKAVENAIALEAVAEMALATRSLDPASPDLEAWVLEKHYQRKHGPAAYYGQAR